MMKEGSRELKDRSIALKGPTWGREKTDWGKKSEQNPKDLWDNYKGSNTHGVGVPEEEGEQVAVKKDFKN